MSEMEKLPEFSKPDKTSVRIVQNPKLSRLCNCIIGRKISEALKYAAKASIYNGEDTIKEMTTSQSVVVTFLYGLISEDIALTAVFAEEENHSEQMKSTYLKVWLRDDFRFPKKDIARGFTFLRKILDVESVHIHQPLLDIIAPLRSKYDVRVRRNGIVKIPDFLADSIRKWSPSANKEMEDEKREIDRIKPSNEKEDYSVLKKTKKIETDKNKIKPVSNFESKKHIKNNKLHKTESDYGQNSLTITVQITPPVDPDSLDDWHRTPEESPKSKWLLKDYTMLHVCAYEGYKDGVSWELNHGEDIDSDDSSSSGGPQRMDRHPQSSATPRSRKRLGENGSSTGRREWTSCCGGITHSSRRGHRRRGRKNSTLHCHRSHHTEIVGFLKKRGAI